MSRPLKDPEGTVEAIVNRAIRQISKLQGLADRGYIDGDQCDKINDAVSKELKKVRQLANLKLARTQGKDIFKL